MQERVPADTPQIHQPETPRTVLLLCFLCLSLPFKKKNQLSLYLLLCCFVLFFFLLDTTTRRAKDVVPVVRVFFFAVWLCFTRVHLVLWMSRDAGGETGREMSV